MKNDASIALSCPQNRTARRVRSYDRLWFGNAIKWLVPQACFKLTGSVLPDAPFLDGGRAGTKPSDFELLRPPPRPFQKASPARRGESQATMRARLCPTSVRIRELNYSSSLDHSEKSL